MDETRPARNRTDAWEPLSPLTTGLQGRCPRCGRGDIFDRYLKVRDRCEVCGLDYSFADPADGPAVFVPLFAAVPGVILVIMLQIMVAPPIWVVLTIGLPVVLLSTLLPLRPAKGWLIATQHSQNAQEAGTEKLWDQLHGRKAEPGSEE